MIVFTGGAGRRQPTEFRCRLNQCNERFENRRELMRHRLNIHTDPQHRQAEWVTPYPWTMDNGEEDPALRRLLEDSRLYIFDKHRHGKLHSIFNFPLNHRTWSRELSDALSVVRESTREALKINLSLGMVLQHRESGDYRYFVAGGNVPLLPTPERIDNQAQWERFIASLQPEQIMERVNRDRPNTKWRLRLVTNLRADVAYLGINMGAGEVPDYILNNRHLLSLTKDQSGRKYDDSFCAFRAIAAHRNLKQGRRVWYQLETETSTLCQLWSHSNLALHELPEFEELFGLRVDIYSLDEDDAVYPRYLSTRKTGDPVVLNLFKDHLSLVTNVNGYLGKFKCASCERHFSRLRYLKQHQGRCARATRMEFTHEHFRPSPTIFEELLELGINVPVVDRFFPWFGTFDCESVLKGCDDRSDKLQWIARHEMVSVSLSSNIDGYRTPKCFVDTDQSKLSRGVSNYLENLSNVAYASARLRWTSVFEAMEADPDDKNLSPELKALVSSAVFRAREKEIGKKFYAYCQQLPVLGFNSASYDLNLMKGTLFDALGFGSEGDRSFVIKKNNSYTVVGTERVRFLDISNYLAPGFSYAQFLRAYGVPEAKSYFPYEWFNDAAKLQEPSLPPYEAFYSKLKCSNVLDEGEGEEEGRRRHSELESIWRDRGMQTFRDFLIYYNNLDTFPMVLAIEKMQQFYFTRQIDLFKVAVSVPGIARYMLYDTAAKAGVSFSSVRPGDEDMYFLIKKNIVGGPSIIFTREHEVGRTRIRAAEDTVCANILGYDANALYLRCIDENQPTGDYVRRFGPDFSPEYRGNRRDMYNWLDYVALSETIEIWHQRNHGEVKIGPYSVDGFVPATKTVLEFDGCFYHGCAQCQLGHADWREKRQKETRERREWLEKNGYVVRVMKEHDFKRQIQMEPALRTFIDERLPPFYRRHRGRTTAVCLINAVRDGLFFGLMEVDIHVPDDLSEHFSEMCPIFTNTDVSFADIGEPMKLYARQHQMSEKSRRLLVSGLRAERILLSSDLLSWYLKKGLVVDKIHQAIEYLPRRCFRTFVNEVSDARRTGDLDPSMKIIADTMKLIGNSAYGSVIMDKEKHMNVKFYNDVWNTQQAINSPRFQKLSEISDDLFEVSSSKTSLRLDLPIQIGFQILQLAKLRMLEFYYDCLDIHCDRSQFEMLEMDTDSAYFAIGGTDSTGRPVTKLEHIARDPSYFNQLQTGFCNDDPYTVDEGHFFPRTCCPRHVKYDSRTPGLFKLEAEGDEMIGLCSKTYVIRKLDKVKISSKGVQKRALHDPVRVFRDVLSTGEPASGINRGFRVRNDTIYTYEQVRYAISYFYCKRQVMENGIDTRPLPITLSPWPERILDIVTEGHPLWPDKAVVFELSFGTFHSLRAVCAHVFSKPERDEMVKEALSVLSDYEPTGELVFISEGTFSGFGNKQLADLWTCGANARCARLVPATSYRGLNRLAELYLEIIDDE